MPCDLMRDDSEHGFVVREIHRRVAETVVIQESEGEEGEDDERPGKRWRPRLHAGRYDTRCAELPASVYGSDGHQLHLCGVDLAADAFRDVLLLHEVASRFRELPHEVLN